MNSRNENRPAASRQGRTGADELAGALEHHRAGRLDRAETLYRKFLDRHPDQPDALHLLGVIASQKGRHSHAADLIARALQRMPRFPDAHLNLGNALRAQGRLAEAEASYRTALTLRPDFAAAHANLAGTLAASKAFAEALAAADAALAIDPALPEAHANRARALLGLGRNAEADVPFRAALRLRPDDIETLCALGALLLDLGRPEEAQRCADAALRRDGDAVAALCLAGAAERRLGHAEESIAAYRRATRAAPRQPEAWTGLGTSLRAAGRFEAAAECYRQAIAIAPDLAEAHRDLALMGYEPAAPARLEDLLADAAAPAEQRVAAGFALGKLHDDHDRYDEAFGCYAQANALFREAEASAGRSFQPGELRAEVDRLIVAHPDAASLTPIAGASNSAMPVFIVGMPRTGSSLIEQILASHPMVFGAGELRLVGELAARLPEDPRLPPESAAMQAAVEGYLARLGAVGANRPRVVDKMPDNIFMLGMIARLLPGARILLCRRDARDTCLSCFFQRFSGSTQLFSYDLAWCGQRFRETERLAAHWHRVLPLQTMEVCYETLVSDLEATTRQLVAFLGLPWDERCLQFHKTERAVLTASSWQVRQPLFSRSVGRWRHYDRHLGPLHDSLDC